MKSGFSENIESQRFEPSSPLLNDVVTEDSAAELFVQKYGEDIRFCHSTGAWFIWNGVRWRRDQVGTVFDKARRLARELGQDQDERGRKVIGKTSFAGGMERFARTDQSVSVIIDNWDCDPWQLGTPGGTVDLTTGKLGPPSRSDGITKSTLCAPLEEGCPRWLQFLDETTGSDQRLVRFLQQWCGYAVTGLTREHALVFVYGPGGNGKSVFLNVVTAILAEYAATSAMDTFHCGTWR
jgi:putative DNA primase/helicase